VGDFVHPGDVPCCLVPLEAEVVPKGITVALFTIVIVLSQAGLSEGKGPGGKDTVLGQIADLEHEYGGRFGFMAVNLRTGDTIAYHDSERFPTASAIKFPIMGAFFNMVDQKKIDLALKVVLRQVDKKPGDGILQFMSDGATITLLDAVKLMIIHSDNTATNLVLDNLAPTHEQRLAIVNDFIRAHGVKDSRLLNRLYSVETKQNTPEAIRYGIGVSSPRDMVTLFSALYRRALADSASCAAMVEILQQQSDASMIPRFLPAEQCSAFSVAHKTGSINENKVDVGLILSDRADIAMAAFVDKHPDHREEMDNRAQLLIARVARLAWNHFTGMTGTERDLVPNEVDWNLVPGGSWAIYRSSAAPFPHPDRMQGYVGSDGTRYPFFPHYADSSIVVFMPDGLTATPEGINVIVHFHGHMNDNLGVLERFKMVQAMTARRVNALLVIPQGPYRARDSFGGKMEDSNGLRNLIQDVLQTMKREKAIATTKLGRLIVSAHSGGYRPAAFVLDRGGLSDKITNVFLFDALYDYPEKFLAWLQKYNGTIIAAYTAHLANEHQSFARALPRELRGRWQMTATTVHHDDVVETFFPEWLGKLDKGWMLPEEKSTKAR
jgi:beta-lactamase class A